MISVLSTKPQMNKMMEVQFVVSKTIWTHSKLETVGEQF